MQLTGAVDVLSQEWISYQSQLDSWFLLSDFLCCPSSLTARSLSTCGLNLSLSSLSYNWVCSVVLRTEENGPKHMKHLLYQCGFNHRAVSSPVFPLSSPLNPLLFFPFQHSSKQTSRIHFNLTVFLLYCNLNVFLPDHNVALYNTFFFVLLWLLFNCISFLYHLA